MDGSDCILNRLGCSYGNELFSEVIFLSFRLLWISEFPSTLLADLLFFLHIVFTLWTILASWTQDLNWHWSHVILFHGIKKTLSGYAFLSYLVGGRPCITFSVSLCTTEYSEFNVPQSHLVQVSCVNLCEMHVFQVSTIFLFCPWKGLWNYQYFMSLYILNTFVRGCHAVLLGWFIKSYCLQTIVF